MAMAMFYGWENVSGSVFIKGKNLKKFEAIMSTQYQPNREPYAVDF